jgi:hypothetical protein
VFEAYPRVIVPLIRRGHNGQKTTDTVAKGPCRSLPPRFAEGVGTGPSRPHRRRGPLDRSHRDRRGSERFLAEGGAGCPKCRGADIEWVMEFSHRASHVPKAPSITAKLRP